MFRWLKIAVLMLVALLCGRVTFPDESRSSVFPQAFPRSFTAPIIGFEDVTKGTIQQASLGATLGINSIGFYDVTFDGVKDPIMWWGYNRSGAVVGQPRLYWQIEGWYHNGPGGHDWTETYLEKVDTGGANYRPFAIGTYDAHAEVTFAADSISFTSRTGAGGRTINPGANELIYQNVPDLVLGNNWWPYKQARAAGGGVYYGLIGLNASDKVMIDELGNGTVAGGTVTATGFVAGAATGLSGNVVVKGSDGNNCTLTFTGGLLTAETCP